MNTTLREDAPARTARAFTIAELMIVLIILGVVLSVVLPSLKHVSARAKAAASQSIMSNISAAAGQFVVDHEGRNPGYFGAGLVGTTTNEGRGFSALHNIMLDLTPGVTAKPAAAQQNVYTVGPGDGNEVNVDLNQLAGTTLLTPGGTVRSYFRPDPKFYYAPVAPGGNLTVARTAQNSSADEHLYLPTLHDAYGQPILAWQEDERANVPLTRFALRDSGQGNDATRVARFYWASNACFLTATAVGRLQTNQATQSLLGLNSGTAGAPEGSLNGLLGNPAFPPAGFAPQKARGPLVFHSAGANGIYLGLDERGSIIARGNNPSPQSLPYIPGIDPMRGGDFDDLIVSAGN